MLKKRRDEDIPIKIGGWDGKFVIEKPVLKEGYVLIDHRRRSSNLHTQDRPVEEDPNQPKYASNIKNQSNTSNLYGYCSEPTILPVQWDGKFAVGSDVRIQRDHQQSDANNLYGYSNEPTILPAQWDGKFSAASNGQPTFAPNRNQTSGNDFYGYSNEPEILPTQWSGKFELDPNDVRLKQERNQSDVRDYADHRNFVQRQ